MTNAAMLAVVIPLMFATGAAASRFQLPIALTSTNIAQYEADLVDPASVYADPVPRCLSQDV